MNKDLSWHLEQAAQEPDLDSIGLAHNLGVATLDQLHDIVAFADRLKEAAMVEMWGREREAKGMDSSTLELPPEGYTGYNPSSRKTAYRGLDPASPLFVSGRTGEGLKLSAKQRDGKTYYSATQLSRLFTRLFEQAGIEGASAQSGRRTLAVKLKRRGIDLRHICEILGIESLEAVKRLCAGDPARLGDIVRRIL